MGAWWIESPTFNILLWYQGFWDKIKTNINLHQFPCEQAKLCEQPCLDFYTELVSVYISLLNPALSLVPKDLSCKMVGDLFYLSIHIIGTGKYPIKKSMHLHIQCYAQWTWNVMTTDFNIWLQESNFAMWIDKIIQSTSHLIYTFSWSHDKVYLGQIWWISTRN